VRDPGYMAMAVNEALRRLGHTGVVDPSAIRVLAGGMSGSAVIAFTLDGVPVVLKRTPASNRDATLMERAVREARFYRDLAERVPVRTPRVLGSDLDPESGVLLLLAAHGLQPPLDAWAGEDYAEVAGELGRFHAAMREVVLPSWVGMASPQTAGQGLEATRMWRDFARTTGLVAGAMLRQMARTIARVVEIDAATGAGPLTLCHGDFHAGNLLRASDGAWVWADWQDVRIGPGVDDLSFFWQRAFAATDAESEPTFTALVDAYWAGLAATGDPGMSRAAFDRALAWSELRGWLLAWPPYLGYLSSTQQERVVARIAALLRDRVDR